MNGIESPPEEEYSLMIGVEDDFHPARKAHPGILVENIDALTQSLRTAGYEPVQDESLPHIKRIFVADPFGNRLEFLERI